MGETPVDKTREISSPIQESLLTTIGGIKDGLTSSDPTHKCLDSVAKPSDKDCAKPSNSPKDCVKQAIPSENTITDADQGGEENETNGVEEKDGNRNTTEGCDFTTEGSLSIKDENEESQMN